MAQGREGYDTMSLIEYLEQSGFTPENDAPLFDYAARWEESNAFLSEVDHWPVFTASVGYLQYQLSGTVPPDDD